MLKQIGFGLIRLLTIPALAWACWLVVWVVLLALGIIDFPEG